MTSSLGGASSTGTEVVAPTPVLVPSSTATVLGPNSVPVVVTCQQAQCIGVANVTVARRVFKNGKQVGWRHLDLGRASLSLMAGEKVTLKLLETSLGKSLLPEQTAFYLRRSPRYRLTLTVNLLGEATTHIATYIRSAHLK